MNKAIDVCLVKLRRKPRALRNFHRLLRQGEHRLLPRINEWMDESIREMRTGLSGMRGKTSAQKVKSIADWDRIKAQGVIILKPTMLELLVEGGKAVVERKIMKQERFDPIGLEAVSWAADHSATLVTAITAETMEGMQAYIAQGIDAGKSVQAIAMELRPLVGLTEKDIIAVANYHEMLILERPEYTAARQRAMAETYAQRLHRKRALLIARTETKNALWEGVFQGYGQMGIKKVEGVSDPEACDWCKDNIDGKVYSLEEARALDSHPGCECAWVMAG